MTIHKTRYIEMYEACGKHGHTEVSSCVCREGKIIALEAAVREFLEATYAPDDGKEVVFVRKAYLNNLRKAYREIAG